MNRPVWNQFPGWIFRDANKNAATLRCIDIDPGVAERMILEAKAIERERDRY
jgi:hypothetical protein